jgi:hypothetical protein
MKLNTCHIDSYHEPQVIEMPYKYLISFQARKVTRQLIRTVDCTASTIINLMVPGNRTTIIKVGDNVMVLKRGLDYVNGRQTFNLPPFHGDKDAASLSIQELALGSYFGDSERNIGLGVSDHTYFQQCLVRHIIIVIKLLYSSVNSGRYRRCCFIVANYCKSKCIYRCSFEFKLQLSMFLQNVQKHRHVIRSV